MLYSTGTGYSALYNTGFLSLLVNNSRKKIETNKFLFEKNGINLDHTFIYRDKFKVDEEEKELKKDQREREKENTTVGTEEERCKAIIPAGNYPHCECC